MRSGRHRGWLRRSLPLPPLERKIVGSSVLTGGTVEVEQTGEAIEVSVSKTDRREIDTIVILKLDGPAAK